MKITSELTPKSYISAMKESMGGHFSFGQDRFTGFFLGNLFTVTHHSAYEWNRRVSNEKCTALGFVKKTPEGCQVKCICLRALLAPTQFLFWLLILWFSTGLASLTADISLWLMIGLIEFAVLAIAAPLSAFFESLTEQGQAGMNYLLQFLSDPKNTY